jgi:hypothetical protein
LTKHLECLFEFSSDALSLRFWTKECSLLLILVKSEHHSKGFRILSDLFNLIHIKAIENIIHLKILGFIFSSDRSLRVKIFKKHLIQFLAAINWLIQSFYILILSKHFMHLLRDSLWEVQNAFCVIKRTLSLLLIRILSVLLEVIFVILSHWSKDCLENNIIP